MKDIEKIIILKNNEAIIVYENKTVAVMNHKEAQLEIQRYINEHNFKTLQEFVDNIIMKTSENSDLEKRYLNKFIEIEEGALRNQYSFFKKTYQKAKYNKVNKLELKNISVDDYDGVSVTYEYKFKDVKLDRKYLTVHGTADNVLSIMEEYILENNITDAKQLIEKNIFDLSDESEDHLVKVTIPKMQEFIVKVWKKSLESEEIENEVDIEEIIDDIDTKFSSEVEETNIDSMIESIDEGLLRELENMKEPEISSIDYYKDGNIYDVLVNYNNGTSEFVNLKEGNEIVEKLINEGKNVNSLLHFHDVTNKKYTDDDTEVSYSEFRNNNTIEEIKESKKENFKNKLLSLKDRIKKNRVVQAAILVASTGLCLLGISKLGNNDVKNAPASDIVAEDDKDLEDNSKDETEDKKDAEYTTTGAYNVEEEKEEKEEVSNVETAKVDTDSTVNTNERKFEYSNIEYDSENDVAYSDLEVYNDLQKYYEEVRRKEAEENLKPITIDVKLTEPEQIDYSNLDNYDNDNKVEENNNNNVEENNNNVEENNNSNQVIENEFETIIANDINEVLGDDNNLYSVTIDADKQDINGNLNNQYMDLSTSNVTGISNKSNEELANAIVEQLANSNENTVDSTYTK